MGAGVEWDSSHLAKLSAFAASPPWKNGLDAREDAAPGRKFWLTCFLQAVQLAFAFVGK